MSLQFLYGPPGSGKSYTLYKQIIERSLREPGREFLILVPEQFSMQTQKTLVEMHPRRGLLNIDVLSFQRLAWRVFEETGADSHKVLEDTGKSLLLRRAAARRQSELTVLGRQFHKPGYIAQVKSLLSELEQYDISLECLDTLIERLPPRALRCKLQDIRILYEEFCAERQGTYLTSEEVLEELYKCADQSEFLKGCVIGLDGFTGFTPIQNKLLGRLMTLACDMFVTVTMGADEDPMRPVPMHHRAYFSKQTVRKLTGLAGASHVAVRPPLVLGREGSLRYRRAPALGFLERNLFRPGQHRYSGRMQEISLRVARDPGEEADAAARRIWHLVREEGLRYRDIAVITGDMDSFVEPLRVSFAQNQIPCFLDRTKKISQNPMIEFLRAALEIAGSGFRYRSVFRYLRTGIPGQSDEKIDMLENYVIARGIQSRKRWEEDWIVETQEIRGKDLADCQETKSQVLEPLCTFVDRVRGKNVTVRCRTEALCDLLDDCQVQEKIQKYEQNFLKQEAFDAAREYHQIYRIVIDLFDKLVELLGDEPMSLQEYTQILDAGLEEAQVGMVPPTADCVLVGDIGRTRLKDIRVLFLLGMNDGWVPARDEQVGILSDMDREEIAKEEVELAPNERENAYFQNFYLYLNLTKPSERLYLSYSRTGTDGKALRPSYMVHTLQAMFPSLRTKEEDVSDPSLRHITTAKSGLRSLTEGLRRIAQGERDPKLLGILSWYAGQEETKKQTERLLRAAFPEGEDVRLSPGTAQELYGQTLVNSVTRLEQFAACPYAHFLQYGLHLGEREAFSFRASDMGTLFHRVLEQYARELEQRGWRWPDVPRKTQERLVCETVEKALQESGGDVLRASARGAYTIQRVKRIACRSIWALTRQICAGSFVPVSYETDFSSTSELKAVSFSLSGTEKIRLSGKIDRIDVCERGDRVYVKVVDYKSGATKFDLTELYHGLQLQLVVYLRAALELEGRVYRGKDIVPAGIFYYALQDPLVSCEREEKESDVEERILSQLRPNGLVNGDGEVVRALDGQFSKTSLVLPVARTRDGSYAGTSSVVTREQFDALTAFVGRKIRSAAQDILDGEVAVRPYERDGRTACDFCPFPAVCGFDRKQGMRYRRLTEYTEKEIWEKLDGECGRPEEEIPRAEGKDRNDRGLDEGTAAGDQPA